MWSGLIIHVHVCRHSNVWEYCIHMYFALAHTCSRKSYIRTCILTSSSILTHACSTVFNIAWHIHVFLCPRIVLWRFPCQYNNYGCWRSPINIPLAHGQEDYYVCACVSICLGSGQLPPCLVNLVRHFPHRHCGQSIVWRSPDYKSSHLSWSCKSSLSNIVWGRKGKGT